MTSASAPRRSADRDGSERVDPVVAALAAVASATPVLLLVDDAEALGPAAADDLASLIALAPAGLLLVVAHREAMTGTPLAAVLAKIEGVPHAKTVTLEPWTLGETSSALSAVVGLLDPAEVAALHDAAGGNPARVTELAAAARSGRTLDDIVASAQPFKGLVPYGQGDAEVFFGRDDDVALVLGRLAGSRMLTVTGPSGAGKSSLVRGRAAPGARPGCTARQRDMADHRGRSRSRRPGGGQTGHRRTTRRRLLGAVHRSGRRAVADGARRSPPCG